MLRAGYGIILEIDISKITNLDDNIYYVVILMPIRDWKPALARFMIEFDGRI